ncbi:unnamed protein product [Adineta ricciae]|uniref:Glucose-methanol-choline oxidoreductase N-terminal domain-containing protein n=1 Tax=Adineta ricciae TaxID=249248 RepID=A0A816F566_ADIRI|nr:unnamed protein product [Adineta ricciae]CAF1658660.1 unnamed protein product [Adineta ricciae]
MENIVADFVVVGGGTAGCILAARLAEHGLETLLLSSGSDDTSNPLMNQKSQFLSLLKATHFKHYLPHMPLPNLNNRTLNLIVWNSLGGNSINWGGLERLTETECNLLVNASGDPSFSVEHMLTYYKMVENFTTTAPFSLAGFHGNNGPIQITHINEPGFSDVWKKVADELGEAFSDDLVGAIDYGFSFEPSSFKNGLRSFSANEYLIPALNKYSNLTLITGATVTKFEVNAITKQIDNLLFVSSNGCFRAIARKEYILSAGAFFSPHLLMLSGIGDPDVLEQNNIPVKHILRQVGKNLTDNGFIELEYEAKDFVIGQCIPVALINTRKRTTTMNPDLFFVLNMHQAVGKLHVSIFNASPRSPSGSISLYSSNPLVPPKVTLNYLDDQKDIETFIDGINYVRRMMSTNAMKHFAQVIETLPGKETNLHMYIRDKLLPSGHFVGTCSMGQDPQTSVVDKDFKVHGINNLRVVDASVFPAGFVSKKGPCLTVYALAEKAVNLLKQQYL